MQRHEPACPKSQGKSTAWPDLGYQSPPPNALTTTGPYSQQEESMGRAGVSWDSALPSLPKSVPSSLRPSPIPALLQTPGWHQGIWLPWQRWHCSALRELGQVPKLLSGRSSSSHSRVNTEPCSHFVSLVRPSDTPLKTGLIWKTLGFWVEVLHTPWTSTQSFRFSFQTSRSKRDGIFPSLCFPCKSAF